MSFNQENIKIIKSLINIKEYIENGDDDLWSVLKAPKSIIQILANKKISKNFLLELIDKIENNIGLNKIENDIYDVFKSYIYIETKNDFNRIREKVFMEFRNKEADYKILNPSKELIYPNQKIAACNITDLLINQNKKAVSLVALPQVGKTGTFLQVSYNAMTHLDNDKMYFPEDIFIITGMSDIDWERQTKNDMLNCIKDNVFHLGKIKQFNGIINTKRNTKLLIIIDECQIATSANQQIDRIFKDIEKTSEDKNIDIKYLVISATPGVIQYDLQRWGSRHELVILDPSNTYVSFKTFINEMRIDDSDLLTTKFMNEKFKPLLINRYKTPKYHIIRVSEKKRGELIKWCKNNDYKYTLYDSNNRSNDDIELYLDNEHLNKHTFIIIKNFWRAGKRMNDSHIGIVYEYNEKIDINITAQGLIARFCGNDKQYNNNTSPYFFGNSNTLNEYINFMEKECNFRIADYTSRNLKVAGGQLIGHTPSTMNGIFEDSHKILYEKEDYIDVPQVINISDDIFNKISSDGYNINSNAQEFIINYLKYDYEDLYKYVSTYKCAKFTIPTSDSNYKRHIIDTKICLESKKVCKTDIKKEDTFNNMWAAFIDKKSKDKKIYFLVYHGEKYKKLKQNSNIINDYITV
jgi:hypothetical protein